MRIFYDINTENLSAVQCFVKKEIQSNLDISNSDNSNFANLIQKSILIAFSNHNLALETFLQVQITRSAN